MIKYPHEWQPERKARLAHKFFLLKSDDEVIQFFQDELARLDSLNRHEDSMQAIRQRQGACLTIEALLKIIEDSRAMYDAFQQEAKMEQLRKANM